MKMSKDLNAAPSMNSKRTRKPALFERLLAVRPLWAVVVATATLMSGSLTAQVRTPPVFLTPDTTPVPPTPQVELPPERPVPQTPPAELPPQTPGERPATIPPKTDGSDPAVSGPAAKAPVLDIIDLAGDEVYVPDASVADTLSRVEGELRKFLKISTTEPGLRLRLRKPFAAGWVSGTWRYLSADHLQVWAMWAYPSNNPSALNFLATDRFIPTEFTDEAQLRDPANFTIGEDRQLSVWDADFNTSAASWNPGRPLSFSATLGRDGTAGSSLSVEKIKAALGSYPNLEIVSSEANPSYFGISGDYQTSSEFPGLQLILDVKRTLQALAKLAAAPAGTLPVTTETVLTANGGLEGLTLQADNPKIEVAENKAYIPLFFKVLGTYTGTNDVVVRARFISGTATPGEDFELGEPERSLPAQGGLTTMDWISVPTLLDEVNEGDETAVFEVFIVGSTNAPIRIEATLLEDSNPGQVGFISPRFQINEGSTNGYAQIRLWRTLNTRQAATVSYRLEGPASALAVLGGETRRTATFQPGDSQVFVQIPLVNDTTAQGTQDVTLTLESAEGGLKLMKGLESTVLTLADDETPSTAEPLIISQYDAGGGQRGVMLSTRVARGYQVLLECSDTGAAGPWRPYWRFEGADTERYAFDSFDASVMRMYRILPPEPLDTTFPW